jgi:hypothetical protein
MESKKINQLATELSPALEDLTIIGDPTTGISKKITLSQMASLFTGTVEEYANLAAFPLVGVADTIYIALDTNILYRWNTGTSAYVELSPNIVSSLVFNDANGFDGTINLVGSVATLTITTALTTGSVGFIGASGALLQDNANFFWDDTNNRLGLGTNAPTTALDIFGSGIIGRINGTSTNNAFLGFSSAGTNKWSVGNVQSDHRFRIFSEANSAELISVLQTGEFGIGIANPTTKFHIDGGASALIANLDANVSVAKSISFRSDNSNRFNIEVSGTESGSNAGADFFIRRYSDLGGLIDTPLTITRSTGAITLTGALSATSATFTGDVTLAKITSAVGLEYQIRNTNGASGNHVFKSFNTAILTLDGASNAATFADIIRSNHTNGFAIGSVTGYRRIQYGTAVADAFSFLANSDGFADLYFKKAVATGQLKTTFSGQSISINAAGTGSVRMQLQNNSIGNAGVTVESSTGGDQFSGTSAYSMAIGTYTARDLFLGTNSVQRLKIDSSNGLVSINETYSSTNYKFAVKGSSHLAGTNNKGLFITDNTTYASIVGLNKEISGYNPLELRASGTDYQLYLTTSGQVNIGSTQTTYPFYVQAALGNWTTVFENTANGASGILMRSTGGAQGFYYGAYDGSAYKFYINGSGVVNSTSTSITIISSDERLKTDIRDYDKGLAEVLAMKPRIYKRKDNLQVDEVGFIAQEMEKALVGSMVDGSLKDEETGEAYKTYQLEWYPLLVKAIQEQQAQIEELKALINK